MKYRRHLVWPALAVAMGIAACGLLPSPAEAQAPGSLDDELLRELGRDESDWE